MRLLIVSHDRVGAQMAGPGIRYWELAHALSDAATVTLAAPAPLDLAPAGFAVATYTPGDRVTLAALTAQAEALLANGHLLAWHPELGELAAPLMLDLYDPTPLENLELFREADPAERAVQATRDTALLQAQLLAGDAFICATERQRDLFVGGLLALGRVTPALADADPLLRRLIDVVSFGLPDNPPTATGPALRGVLPGLTATSKVLLWTGGLWDWMDPLTLIRAMPAVLAQIPDARLVFLAGPHPGGAAPMRMPAAARALAAELGLPDGVVQFYAQWVPYTQRSAFLLEADLLVSLGRPGLENAYAALRSRFLDHLWAGRASLVSAGDAAAELVERHGLGRVTPPGDIAATAAAIVALLQDDTERAACARRARELAPAYHWRRVAAPIRRWLADPRRTRPVRTEATAARPAAVVTPEHAMDDNTRNDTIKRLDELWQLEPRPLTSEVPGLGRAKELANSLTKWYVQAIVEQQNAFNAAVVHAMQALAANDDRRHAEVSNQARQALTLLQKRIEQLGQRIEEHARHLADIDDAQTALAETLAELRELAAALGPAEEQR